MSGVVVSITSPTLSSSVVAVSNKILALFSLYSIVQRPRMTFCIFGEMVIKYGIIIVSDIDMFTITEQLFRNEAASSSTRQQYWIIKYPYPSYRLKYHCSVRTALFRYPTSAVTSTFRRRSRSPPLGGLLLAVSSYINNDFDQIGSFHPFVCLQCVLCFTPRCPQHPSSFVFWQSLIRQSV